MEVESLYVGCLFGLFIAYVCSGLLGQEMILIVSLRLEAAVEVSRVMSSVTWSKVAVDHCRIMKSVTGIVTPSLCMIVYLANM